MTIGAHITPSPERSRGNGLETRPGAKPLEEGGVALNLPHPSRSPRPFKGGEEVRWVRQHFVHLTTPAQRSSQHLSTAKHL
jgi:hypothetical protein